MENSDHVTLNGQNAYQIVVPPRKPFMNSFLSNLKEVFFPDDPLRQFKNQTWSKKVILGLTYIFPILEWLPYYTFQSFRSDVIAGITTASVAIPQGISYAGLASLPATVGLYSTFVPALVYVIMGCSRHVAVGTVAVSSSLVMASMLSNVVSPTENPELYSQLVYTATLIAGLLQAGMGLLRLGFLLDFLSHSTIKGSLAGAATVVILQQFKGLLGLEQFTKDSDIVSVTRSVFTQTRNWNWKTLGMGCSFLVYLLLAKCFSKRKPKYFWVSATAPITSVIVATLAVFLTKADDKQGIQVIGILQEGLNPISVTDLVFNSPYISKVISAGLFTGILSLTDGISAGRNFAMINNYHIDGNKEMIAIGMMNIVGSCTSCYVATSVLSRTAVNAAAGCKTAFSNFVTAITIMITLKYLTPLFKHTPQVVLSAIINSAMISMIDYNTAIRLYKQDKFDFVICMSAYIGVVFVTLEKGLGISVALSVFRVLLSTARPKTSVLGNIPNSSIYRDVAQYPNANTVPGVLILHINGPIYFANSGYLRERILRWIVEEEGKKVSLQYVVLDMGAIGSIDASGISMLKEVKKNLYGRGLTLVLANPGSEVIKKLDQSKFVEDIGREWIYLTVGGAVAACNFKLHQAEPAAMDGSV